MAAVKWCVKLWLFCMIIVGDYVVAQESFTSIADRYKLYDEGKIESEKNTFPGLLTEKLLDAHNYQAAKDLLISALLKESAPHKVIHFLLAKIAAHQNNYKDFRGHFTKSQIAEFHNLTMVEEIYDLVPKKEQAWLVNLLIKHNNFAEKYESLCPYFELVNRKNRAKFLYKILTIHTVPAQQKEQMLYELYVRIPEAIPAVELKKLSRFKEFKKALRISDYAMRMENLLTFGKNEEARQTFVEAQASQKKDALVCELDYIDAKVDRKMRKYDLAKKRFLKVASVCPKDWQIKSRYMYLLLASTLGDEAALPMFDAFVADYPTHSFSDDVLVFKASMLLDKGKDQEALVVLDQAIAQFPQGDMIPRALFLKAMSHAKAGQNQAAQEALGSLKKISAKDSLDYHQAQYWQARFLLFPNPFELAHHKPNRQAESQLLELAQALKPTVYSWLAESLLTTMKKKVKRPKIAVGEKDEEMKVFSKDKRLEEVHKAVRFGFRKEALMILSDMVPNQDQIEMALEMAWYFYVLNRPELGHQKLIRCDPTLAAALESRIPHIYRCLAYPFIYRDLLKKMSEQFSVPIEVTLGIIRQESGFIAESCSWAGAKGPMQLMYASAKGQAARVGIKDLREDDLYSPSINVTLGTSLFKNYWIQWGSLPQALAAYNAGPSPTKTWTKKMPSLALDTFIENISYKETRDYVKKVLGSINMYRVINGAQYLPLAVTPRP